jgi:sugar lactone lactonase YvrE
MVSPYPEGLGARANDMCADPDGNLITGTLNMGPADGSVWWFSAREGWRLVDDDISNTNGPAVAVLDGSMTLIVGDTSAPIADQLLARNIPFAFATGYAENAVVGNGHLKPDMHLLTKPFRRDALADHIRRVISE